VNLAFSLDDIGGADPMPGMKTPSSKKGGMSFVQEEDEDESSEGGESGESGEGGEGGEGGDFGQSSDEEDEKEEEKSAAATTAASVGRGTPPSCRAGGGSQSPFSRQPSMAGRQVGTARRGQSIRRESKPMNLAFTIDDTGGADSMPGMSSATGTAPLMSPFNEEADDEEDEERGGEDGEGGDDFGHSSDEDETYAVVAPAPVMCSETTGRHASVRRGQSIRRASKPVNLAFTGGDTGGACGMALANTAAKNLTGRSAAGESMMSPFGPEQGSGMEEADDEEGEDFGHSSDDDGVCAMEVGGSAGSPGAAARIAGRRESVRQGQSIRRESKPVNLAFTIDDTGGADSMPGMKTSAKGAGGLTAFEEGSEESEGSDDDDDDDEHHDVHFGHSDIEDDEEVVVGGDAPMDDAGGAAGKAAGVGGNVVVAQRAIGRTHSLRREESMNRPGKSPRSLRIVDEHSDDVGRDPMPGLHSPANRAGSGAPKEMFDDDDDEAGRGGGGGEDGGAKDEFGESEEEEDFGHSTDESGDEEGGETTDPTAPGVLGGSAGGRGPVRRQQSIVREKLVVSRLVVEPGVLSDPMPGLHSPATRKVFDDAIFDEALQEGGEEGGGGDAFGHSSDEDGVCALGGKS
jgi:hypothetical protein